MNDTASTIRNRSVRNRWRLPQIGIRALLIFLLLPGVVLLLVIDSWNDYRTLAEITNEAYDSRLTGTGPRFGKQYRV